MHSVVFHPLDVVDADVRVLDEGRRSHDEAELRIWGIQPRRPGEAKSRPVLVRVKHFFPWCYLDLPPAVEDARAHEFALAVLRAAKVPGDDVEHVDVVKKTKLFYAQVAPDSFTFAQIFFRSRRAMTAFAKTVETAARLPRDCYKLAHVARVQDSAPRGLVAEGFGRVVPRVWEWNPAMVPTARRAFTIAGVQFAGWMTAEARQLARGDPYDELTIALPQESPQAAHAALARQLRPVPADEAAGLVSAPGILAFDIECYSANPKALPNPAHAANAAFMLTAAYAVLAPGERAAAQKFLIRTAVAACDDPPDTRVIVARDESEVLPLFAELVAQLDPDILTGYNINGFDYNYLAERYAMTCRPKGGAAFGKPVPNGLARLRPRYPAERVACVREHRTSSSNYGKFEMFVLAAEGRVSVDLLVYMRREHPRLDRHTLAFVSRFFLGDTKDDVSHLDIFAAYAQSVAAQGARRRGEPGAADATASARAAMSRVARYAVKDSDLVLRLWERLNVWIGLRELACVAGVPLIKTLMAGQQIRLLSLLYDKAARANTVIDGRQFYRAFGEDVAPDDPSVVPMKGATVVPPLAGLHRFVITLDFSSLYPSIMRAHNLCPSTLALASTPLEASAFSGLAAAYDARCAPPLDPRRTADASKAADARYAAPSEQFNLYAFTDEGSNKARAALRASSDVDGSSSSEDEGEGYVQDYALSFLKRSVREGFMPLILGELLFFRQAARAEQKRVRESDPVRWIVLEQRQLGYKVVMNSGYGFLGAKVGMLPCIEAAKTVTAEGRAMIARVNAHIAGERHRGTVVYGDTDSSMFTLPAATSWPECHRLGHVLERELTDMFERPIAMEFEKAMDMLSITKKRYEARKYDAAGRPTEVVHRGTLLARREAGPLLRGLYGDIVADVLERDRADPAGTLARILGVCRRLLTRAGVAGVAPREVAAATQFTGRATAATAKMKVFGDHLAEIGRPAAPGDRLEYVIRRDPAQKNVSQRMVLLDMWADAGAELDGEYYLANAFAEPVDQLFETAFGDLAAGKDVLTIYPTARKGYTIMRPVEFLLKAVAAVRTERRRNARRLGPVDEARLIADEEIENITANIQHAFAEMLAK